MWKNFVLPYKARLYILCIAKIHAEGHISEGQTEGQFYLLVI